MNKDFVEVANDSGSNNGSFDVVCGKNRENKRSTILTVSGGGVNKTINITQKTSNLGSIEIVGGVYYSNGTLATIRSFSVSADIKISMTSPQVGRFIFPALIQEMDMYGENYTSFLRIKVNAEIPSYYKGEKVVAFLENINGNTIYTPKKELTVDVYKELDKNVFDLNMADEINVGNTEIININSALNNRLNVAILLTNNKTIQFINFVWKAVYYESQNINKISMKKSSATVTPDESIGNKVLSVGCDAYSDTDD